MVGEKKAGHCLFEVSSWEFDDRTVFGNLRVAWSERSPLDDTSRKEVFPPLPKDLALFIFHIFIEGVFQREPFFMELTQVTLQRF